MSINNAKHIVGEIDGVRCTIIESGIEPQRSAFLTDLLEFNHFEVKKMLFLPGRKGKDRNSQFVSQILFSIRYLQFMSAV
jgi:hypothetical protein